MTDDVLPALGLVPTLQSGGTLSPIDLLSVCIKRVAQTGGAINAVVELDSDNAEQAARESTGRWQRGAELSPIDGAPILVKANIAVKGLPWHAGIDAYRDRIAQYDAPIIARLRDAGAIILGLTNMDEGALGASGDNHWLGRIGNPHRPGFSAGGSSGGSAAAVAAGFCLAALGSDTIGSIAIPAAYCAVVGHRASRDLMPITGIVPLSPSFDHGGWHTRSVCGAMALSTALGVPMPAPRPFRIAILKMDSPSLEAGVDAAVAAGVEKARSAGWSVDHITLPIELGEVVMRLFEVAEAEGAVVHSKAMIERPERLSPAFLRMLAWGADKGISRLEGHLTELARMAAMICGSLTDYDALLLPATPQSGFIAGLRAPVDQAIFAALPACLGWPATTIPSCDKNGFALLVTARSDAICLAIAVKLLS